MRPHSSQLNSANMTAASCNCPDFKCRCDFHIQSKCLECRTPQNPRDLIYCRCLFALCAPCYNKLYPGHNFTGPCVACDCEFELHPVVHYLQVQLRRAEFVLALAGRPSESESESESEKDERTGGSQGSNMSDEKEQTNPASDAPPSLRPAVFAAPAAPTTEAIPPFVFVIPGVVPPPASTKRPLESSPEPLDRLSKRRIIDFE